MRITKNPDEKEYEEVTKEIEGNSGYCISRTQKLPETMCICSEFLDSDKAGLCTCGRYIKILND